MGDCVKCLIHLDNLVFLHPSQHISRKRGKHLCSLFYPPDKGGPLQIQVHGREHALDPVISDPVHKFLRNDIGKNGRGADAGSMKQPSLMLAAQRDVNVIHVPLQLQRDVVRAQGDGRYDFCCFIDLDI